MENLIDKIDEKTFRLKDILLWITSLYLLYNSLLVVPSLKNHFNQGQRQGIELTNAIYNVSGSNEPLRYTSVKGGEQ